jgi:hypothetical protein
MHAILHNSVEKSVAIVGFLALALIVLSEAFAISRCYGDAERPYREPAHSILNATFSQKT